jgi:hypothetical protein
MQIRQNTPVLNLSSGQGFSNPAKIDLMLDDSIYVCGLAAAQCGEALPHRCISKIDWRLRLRFMRHDRKNIDPVGRLTSAYCLLPSAA